MEVGFAPATFGNLGTREPLLFARYATKLGCNTPKHSGVVAREIRSEPTEPPPSDRHQSGLVRSCSNSRANDLFPALERWRSLFEDLGSPSRIRPIPLRILRDH